MPSGYPGRTHGIVGTYLWGCRCKPCCEATSRYYGHTPMDEYRKKIAPPHGTESRYNSQRFKCRCSACRKASRDARADRRAKEVAA